MTKHRPLPPIDELRKRLAYRSDGVLIWKRPFGRKVKAGFTAGTINARGYSQIKFYHVLYFSHRMIWAMLKHEDPLDFEIDHINQNTLDNRIENLRKATHGQNNRNKPTTKGYCFSKYHKKWSAEIMANGKKNHLGYFDTKEQAREAYLRAKEKLHGEFMPTDMKHELGQIDGPTSQLNIFND